MKHRAGLIEAVNSILFFLLCECLVTDIVSTGQPFVDRRRLEKAARRTSAARSGGQFSMAGAAGLP